MTARASWSTHVVLEPPDDGRLLARRVGRVRVLSGRRRQRRCGRRRTARRAPASRARRCAIDRERRAARRRPDVRPVGAGERRAAPGGPARRSTRSPRARSRSRVGTPGSSGDRRVVAVPVGQVEQAAGDERRRAVREDVAELGRQVGDRHAEDVTREPQPRMAEDLELGRRAAPSRRSASRRRRRAGRPAAPTAGCPAHEIQAAVPTSPRTCDRVDRRRRPGGSVAVAQPRRRPGRLGAPLPRISARSGSGRVERRTKTRDRRLLVDAVGLVARASGRTSGSAPARGRCAARAATVAVEPCGSTARAAARFGQLQRARSVRKVLLR